MTLAPGGMVIRIDIEPGQLVGEIAMFSADKTRTQTIQCVEPCVFLRITEDKALQVFLENPEFGLYLIKMIVDRLLTNATVAPPLRAV